MRIASGADVKVGRPGCVTRRPRPLSTPTPPWPDTDESTRTGIDAVMQARVEDLHKSAAE